MGAREEAEARAERQLIERQAADDERNRLKRERRHKENLEVQEYLRAQMKYKEDQLRKEIEEDIKYGKQMAEAAEKSLEKDELKQQKRQERLYKQAEFITNQIADNEEQRIRERADMNEDEKLMNMSLIRKIEAGDSEAKAPKHDPKRPFSWRYNYRSKPF